MAKVVDENSKMGVDQVKTVLNMKTQVISKESAKNKIMFNGLREAQILATKALLDSVMQSTKEVTDVLKITQKDTNLECYVKQSGCDKGEKIGNRDGSEMKRTVQHFASAKRVPKDTVTLTLDPVPITVSNGVVPGRKPIYYSKVVCDNPKRLDMPSDNPSGSLLDSVNNESAVRKFLEWRAKHFRGLAYMNSPSSATSKLKAIAAKSHASEGSVSLTSSALPRQVISPICSTPLQLNSASENKHSATKRKYFTISNHYFQYLNRPKYAKHDIHHVVFRAQVVLDCDSKSQPKLKTLFPKTFTSCPSGKTPLPGYKGKRRLSRIESFIPRKKRRTMATYRVPKPKPRVIPQLSRTPLHVVPRNSSLPTVKKPRFFPSDKLKWDSTIRRYVVQSQQTSSAQSKGQWFSFPSASKIPGYLQLNAVTAKKKLGTSGSLISTSFQPNFRHPFPTRTVLQPVKIQHVIKDINGILKCKKPPNPCCFRLIEDYTAMCCLYRIRKVLAARAIRFGYIEGSSDVVKEKSEGDQAPTKRAVSNHLVLLSSQTETTLKMWSTHLPKARELDKVAMTQTPSGSDISRKWLHFCQSGQVEELICRKREHPRSKLFEEASEAWFSNCMSFQDSSGDGCAVHLTQVTGGPSHTPISHADLQNIHTKNSAKWGSDLYNKMAIPKTQNPVCIGQGEMKRSLSQVHSLDHLAEKAKNKIRVLPQPSYCVRYRTCFCRTYCTGIARDDRVTTLHCHSVSSSTVQTVSEDIEPSSTEVVVCNGVNSRYEFSEQSVIPSITLKDRKWDVKGKRLRSRSAVELEWGISKSSCDSLDARGKLIRKIGCTEIYHKWAVRRFSNPESSIDPVVRGMSPNNLVKKAGFTDVRSIEGTGSELNQAQANGKTKPRTAKTEDSLREEDNHMEALFEVVEELNIDAKRCKFFHSKGSVSEAERITSPLTVVCPRFIEALPRECLYSRTKRALSDFAAFDGELVPRTYDNLSPSKTLQNDKRNGFSSSLVTRSLCHEGVIDKRVRHLSDAIGRENSKEQHVVVNPDKQSLGVDLESGVESPVRDLYPSPIAGSMGNRLRKSNGRRASSPLKQNFAKPSDLPSDGEKNMAPVLANGVYKSSQHIDRGVKNVLSGYIRDLSEDYEDGLNLCGSKRGGSAPKETVIAGPKRLGSDLAVRNDTERKTRSMSRAINNNTTASTERRKRSADNLQETGKDTPRGFSKILPSSVSIETTFNTDTVKKERKTVSELELPVETRSSRRLRSRVNNKRGRYESDYVSDLPKAKKKPKRILPTRDYDNDDFWQFYRDHEKTVYSKNLILQSKYIKLLKRKGIKSSIAGSQSALFSSVVCASSSVPNASSVIPDDGLVQFARRLTKPRKTPQSLPNAADEHCPYCGRSFVGEDKEQFDAHVARHGMRYTMLTAPQAPKKKKKPTKNGRKDFIHKRHNSASNKAVVSNSLERKQNSMSSLGQITVDESNTCEPLPKPSHLTMGHRKQTARKSFSLASTLPKDMLIAALECKMRAQSTITGDKTNPPAVAASGEAEQEPSSANKQSPLKNTSIRSDFDNPFMEPLHKPHSARKTLTGLPITYNHLNRSYAISFPNKSSR